MSIYHQHSSYNKRALALVVGIVILLILAMNTGPRRSNSGSHGPLSSTDRESDCSTSATKQQQHEKTNDNSSSSLRIPRTLHHIYLNGYNKFEEETSSPDASIKSDWMRSCLLVHQHWEKRFWDQEAVLELIDAKYPWLKKPYLEDAKDCKINSPDCDPVVLQGDIARLLVLHAHGGLYVDADVECWVPADNMLEGYDVVFQATATFEGVTNAIMAGVAGHDVWLKAMEMAAKRVGNASMHVFDRTGPNLVGEIARSLGAVRDQPLEEEEADFTGEHVFHDGTTMRAYRLGTFFTPCWAFDRKCYARMVLERGMGLLPSGVVGFHRYSGSWGGGKGNKVSVHSLEGAKEAVCGEGEGEGEGGDT